jgi:hypothetical protein
MNDAFLLENGTVIDGTGSVPFAAAVLVEGDSIAALGEDALARAQHLQHARRIDVSGMTVMPGLIDAHCHLSFDDAASNPEIFYLRRNALSALVATYNAKKLLRAGVTGILDPDSVFENMVDVRDAIEAGVAEGPRISCGCYALITGAGGTAGRLINDTGVTGYYKVVRGNDEIVAEVRRQAKVGADWIKVHVSGIVPRYAHLGEQCSWTQEELRAGPRHGRTGDGTLPRHGVELSCCQGRRRSDFSRHRHGRAHHRTGDCAQDSGLPDLYLSGQHGRLWAPPRNRPGVCEVVRARDYRLDRIDASPARRRCAAAGR